jgi:hypothetical protein
MRNIKWDVVILLNIGLLLLASVSMLHKHISAKQDKSVTPETVYALLQPLLYARSIDTLARAMLQFPADVVYRVLPKMITESDSPLNDEDKTLLMVAIAYYQYKQYKVEPAKIFSWLVDFKQVFERAPLFLALARTNYASIISQILAYASNSKAVEQNDIQAYSVMDQYGIVPGKEMLNVFLLRVAQTDKNLDFITIFQSQGADLNVSQDGNSALTLAISENNEVMVQALLEAGANPNFMPSPQIGSPLQYAFEKGYVEIEDLLRSYGAHL